ncbi:hypothetical protein LSTR_LSTR012835 [Laodelphax striatellus]|uniref:BZIP domain-containing protein n=1 Tax=Laodelphax striatellus TaxID=195883 RepID=A0A482XC58_LAOST|nr:hypothetical protein LSTR_LSTR012835 [Laodelphax striatellus]
MKFIWKISMDQVSSDKCDGAHPRRHEMILNITPKTSSICTDQTPTPTRLIRKCEEVGLFQDLQNVNPFEETFRKAVEAVRTGSTPLHVSNLSVPSNNADDTLHTPNLFPNVPENELPCSRRDEIVLNDKVCDTPEEVHLTCDEDDNNTDLQPRSPCANLINVLETCPTTGGSNAPHLTAASALNNQNSVQILLCTANGSEPLNVLPVETVDLTSVRGNSIHLPLASRQELQNGDQSFSQLTTQIISQEEIPSVKNKLKQSLLKNSHCTKNQDEPNNNDKQLLSSISKSTTASKVLIPPLSKTPLLPLKRKLQPESIPVEDVDIPDDKKDKLEKNRASAMRCRAKRKKMMEELQFRCNSLETVNSKLNSVISNLRAEIAQLQTLLLAHRNCPVTDAMVQEGKVEKSEQVITFSLPSVTPPDEKSQVPLEKSKLTIRMVDGTTNKVHRHLGNNSSRIIPSSAVPLLKTDPVKTVLILPKASPTNCIGGSKSVATNVIQVNPNITARNNVR